MDVKGTTNFSDKLRKGGIALAAATAMFAANAASTANAATFTEQECKVVALVASDVVKTLGPNTLSKDFRVSFMRFIAPDGKRATCTGPTQIATPTGADIDAYNTIRTFLGAGENPIDLQKRGIQAVAQLAMN